MTNTDNETTTRSYILLDGVPYPTDTDRQIAAARAAMIAAGEIECAVYVGDPSDPDSYPSASRLFAPACAESAATR